MKKNKKTFIILSLLTLFIIIILFVNHFISKVVSANYSNGEIGLKLNVPNPKNVETIKLTYTLFFLDNYKNVSPLETSTILKDSTSEYIFKIDSAWFLGKKDLIEFTLDITYKNGNHKKYMTSCTDFLDELANYLCLTPLKDSDYYIYRFHDITVKVPINDIPENLVFFKSFINPDEIFYIGFKYNSYLYPIKEFQVLLKSEYDNFLDHEKRGTVIPFVNESSSIKSLLLNNEYIEHPWAGLYPFDEKGELIEFTNKIPVGLSFIYNSEVSEVYQNSIKKYSEYFQSLPKIEFYYEP